MNEEVLCLRWNNHVSTFNKLLNNLYLKENYSDGTILCDGTFYPVHSFVLASCSAYFEEIFKQCNKAPNNHPYIVVRDVDKAQMEAILTYMYKGEVVVPESTLPDLIKAAEVFKVKGLGVRENRPKPTESFKRQRSPSTSSVPVILTAKRPREAKCHTSNNNSSEDGDNDPLSTLKIEPSCDDNSSEGILKEDFSFDQNESSGIEIKEENLESFNDRADDSENLETKIVTGVYEDPEELSNLDTLSSCLASTDAAFVAQNTYKPRLEIFTNDAGNTVRRFRCPHSTCEYQSSRNSDVWRHYTKHTGYKPFKCPLCNYGTNHTGHLKRHFSRAHKNDSPEDFGIPK